MKLLRSFPHVAFALVLLAIAGYCAALQSVTLLLVTGTLAALSWYVTEGPRGRTLPKWVSNILVIALALSVLVDVLSQHSEILDVLGRFTIWLTMIKLYERRSARDHAQLMGLSMLLMFVGCLKSADLLYGMVLLLYALVGLYALLLYQLYAASELFTSERRRQLAVDRAELPRGSPIRPVTGRHTAGHFRGLAIAIGVIGIGLSVVMFVLFPRNLGAGVLNLSSLPGSDRAVVGYTDEVDLRTGGRITDSRRPVFAFSIENAFGRRMRLPQPVLLRGAVLESYNRGRWSAASSHRSDQKIDIRANEMSSLTTEPIEGPAHRLHARFLIGTEVVFTPYLPVRVGASPARELRLNEEATTLRVAKGSVNEYTIDFIPQPSDAQASKVAGSLASGSTVRGFSDRIGASRPNVGQLAASILARAGLSPPPTDPEEKYAWNLRAAAALADYLRSGEFAYTLDLTGVEQRHRDPIVNFLFVSRKGHCEFFASALTAMCHVSEIDARVVTGFVAYNYDETNQRYIVSEGNAHAWTEVRSGEHRYTAIDPTPPGVLVPGPEAAETWTNRFGWFYQRLEGAWHTQVVQFDQSAQSDLLESLEGGWSRRLVGAVDTLRAWAAEVNRAFNVGPGGYIWLGIVAFALSIAAVALMRFLGRRIRIRRVLHLSRMRRSEVRQLMHQLGFYLDMLRVLKRRGCRKPDWMPPLTFAQQLDRARPAVAPLVHEVTDLFYRARYGRERLSGAEMTRAHELINRLDAALREHR